MRNLIFLQKFWVNWSEYFQLICLINLSQMKYRVKIIFYIKSDIKLTLMDWFGLICPTSFNIWLESLFHTKTKSNWEGAKTARNMRNYTQMMSFLFFKEKWYSVKWFKTQSKNLSHVKCVLSDVYIKVFKVRLRWLRLDCRAGKIPIKILNSGNLKYKALSVDRE